MTERIRHAIGVPDSHAREVRFFHGEQIFFDLLEKKIHPSIGEMIAVMQRMSAGDVSFETGNKLSGIALDSRLTIETQPEFGMVVFATPG
jgi:hypothetical protein